MDPVTSTAPEESPLTGDTLEPTTTATLTSAAPTPSPTSSQDAAAATAPLDNLEPHFKMSSSMPLDLLCIDPNGLCLAQEGSSLPASHAGTYSALLRLASQLSANQSLKSTINTVNNSSSNGSTRSVASTGLGGGASPTVGATRGKSMRLRVSIESDQGSVLIQNKNGYTIALGIPSGEQDGPRSGVNGTGMEEVTVQ